MFRAARLLKLRGPLSQSRILLPVPMPAFSMGRAMSHEPSESGFFKSHSRKEVVVVTGASSGIGNKVVERFAQEECYEVLAIARNKTALEKLAASNKRIIPISADLTDEHALKKISHHFNSGKKAKYVINCAASADPFSPLTTVSRSALRMNVELNVLAPIFLLQHLLPYFLADTRFLFLGSDYTDTKKTFHPNLAGTYAISKTALRTVVEYLRAETKHRPLIGYLNPGATLTPMYNSFIHKMAEQGESAQDWNPVDPDHVAIFIKSVLEHTSPQLYSETDWNFEDKQHRDKSGYDVSTSVQPEVKLSAVMIRNI